MAPVVGPKYKLLARYGNNVQEVWKRVQMNIIAKYRLNTIEFFFLICFYFCCAGDGGDDTGQRAVEGGYFDVHK
jgi:hypothetical protein